MVKITAQCAKRNLLKKIQSNDIPDPVWNCGSDVPLSWEPTYLRSMAFKTIKHNLKIESISREMYIKLMEYTRNKLF